MDGISTDIPFLAGSRLRFSLWLGNSDGWERQKEATVCLFFQSRHFGEWEFRFGPPPWGLPGTERYVSLPFFPLEHNEVLFTLQENWESICKNETILVLVTPQDEKLAKQVFAGIESCGKAQDEVESIFQKWNLEIPKTKHTPLTPVHLESASTLFTIIDKGNPQKPVFSPSLETKEVLENKETWNSEKVVKEISEPKPKVQGTDVTDTPKAVNSEEKSLPPVDTKSQAKFSLQLKMMGVISLLFAISVSVIISIASYYFKESIRNQLLVNNIGMTEIIGLKVKTDILGVVEKGRQIALTLTTQGVSEADKNLLINTFFQNDKEFIYLGIFEKADGKLAKRKEVFNAEELKKSQATEEDFHSVIERNSEILGLAFSGQAVLINSSPGFVEPSFAIGIPTEENGNLDNVLIMIVKLSKITSAFADRGIATTFLVNGLGTVLAHPKEDLVLAASNLSEMPIVKYMATNPATTAQTTYVDKELGGSYLGSYQKIGFADAGVITIVSEEKAFEDVAKSQRTNLYIAAIGLCSALILVFFFAKSVTQPVLRLLTATLEIAKGNFKIGIRPTTKDEVGLLTEYFVEMGKGLEEREKVKSILGSMIDPVVVQEAMVDLAALKRGSETHITAFFSDVAGFSTISEQLQSADLAALLNEYLSAMTLLLKKHDGVLDKYIGDAIVGIFNAPVPVENHELKAARASAEMVLQLADLREFWTKNNLYTKEAQTMDARIGLNSGPAKVGFMGTDALASYTMMGDTVNLAARLEAAGKDYGVNILITEPIAEKIREEMVIRYLDLVRVKGKNEPVKIYELVGFRSMVSSDILSSIEIYEKGFEEYRKQNWVQAIRLFEEAEKAKGKKDKASQILTERCITYQTENPGSSWDGVFTRTHK